MSEKIKFNITGMTCVNCANAIEKNAKKIAGVISSSVSFTDSSGVFEVSDENVANSLKDKIKKLGYGVASNYDELERQKEKDLVNLKIKLIISAVLSVAIMIFEMNNTTDFFQLFFLLILASIVTFYCGFSFYKHAYNALKSFNFDMNTLISLGSLMAYLYSILVFLVPNLLPENMRYLYFSSSAMIITFVLLGKFLEQRSKIKAGNYLKSLMDLTPKTALVLQPDGQSVLVPIDKLKLNDIVVVKNGYSVPSDGIIISGGAEIDTSALTGESMPVYKGEGDDINAGTMNINGYINVKVTKLPQDSLLSQILELLIVAGSKKMSISRVADRVSNIFVPVVIIIAIATLLIWLAFGEPTRAVLSAICVLIISCPCALGLATPIAIISGISQGAKNGILIKNPEVMEIMGDVKYAVFDKTGTLTKGEISVIKTSLNKEDLKIVACVEALSEHLVSKAIVKYAFKLVDNNISYSFVNILGMGISANEGEILIGNEKLLTKFEIELQPSQKQEIDEILNDGYGVILVAIDRIYRGYIVINDTIKDDAKQSIERIKELGIVPVMLTGDNEKTANLIAKQLGIDIVFAGVLPDTKFKVIQDLKKDGAKVVFIGDGINDAPPLKAADIGIAMSSGSDIAKDAGDIVLIKNNLISVALSIVLAKECMKTIKQNLAWAFIYNIVFIPAAAGILYPFFGILLTPMYGAAAMSISSVTVVLNSLRLKLSKF